MSDNHHKTTTPEETALRQIDVHCATLESVPDVTAVSMGDFLEALAEGAIVVDQQGQIVTLNQRAERMFGYSVAELRGCPLEVLLPERFATSHRHLVLSYFQQPAQRPMGHNRELLGRRKDGSEFPVEVGLNYLELETGVLGLAFVVDITRRKAAEEALERSNRELQARNEDLDAFAHTVAHDLKSPLAVVIGMARTLGEDPDTYTSEALQHYLSTIARSGEKMDAIIDALLLMASVRQEQVGSAPLNMERIVGETLHRLSFLVEERKAEIRLPSTWPVALGHPQWVEEVWVNYLSNALKYGGDPPHIEVGATPQEGWVDFWVQDHGPGLTEEEQARLFERFARVERVKAEGHGLGLSIVRRIVEKLGGQVYVQSRLGEGSRFGFTLPAMSSR